MIHRLYVRHEGDGALKLTPRIPFQLYCEMNDENHLINNPLSLSFLLDLNTLCICSNIISSNPCAY